MTVVFTDSAKWMETIREERKEERRYLPLISSVIITAVIFRGHKERNRTIPSLCSVFLTCFPAEHVRENTREEELEREQERRQEGESDSGKNRKKGKDKKRDKEKERMRGWCFQAPDGL